MNIISKMLMLNLLGTAVWGRAPVYDVKASWDDFRQKFDKNYTSAREEAMRLAIFSSNVKRINIENSLGHTYELGIGPFADLTLEEFRARHKSVRPNNIWGKLKKLGTHGAKDTVTVPDYKDWTKENAVTRVKNQGSCGSCWAFSTTGALEGAFAVLEGTLISLSEQNILDCDSQDQKCNGGMMDTAFSYVESKGLCSEETYPYECYYSFNPYCIWSQCTSACTTVIAPGQLTCYKDVEPKNNKALQSAIAQQPVSVAIEADSFVFQHFSKGVISSAGCGESLDHGVLAVGYGTEDGVDFWKVKNSWGPEWGEDGYVKIARDTAEEQEGGVCGILQGPSYPILFAGTTNEVII